MASNVGNNGNGQNGNGQNGNGKGANGLSKLEMQWTSDPRWEGVTRPYTATTMWSSSAAPCISSTRSRGWAPNDCGLCCTGNPYVQALGAVTGNQAVQQVKAGLSAIYVSGWQVAADANGAAQTYPDQSLYPADSVPNLVRRINQALLRADQIHHAEAKRKHIGWLRWWQMPRRDSAAT